MSGTTTNRLTSRALALALRGSSVEEATAALLAIAGSNRTAVEHALFRIRRGLDSRPSRVGQQAVASLERVLACIGSREAAVGTMASRAL